MKSLTYFFHMKTKTLADFQICISVPLTIRPTDFKTAGIYNSIFYISIRKNK